MSKINITPLEVINFFLEDCICDYSGKVYVRLKSLRLDEIHSLVKLRQELINNQEKFINLIDGDFYEQINNN